jgi:nucleotide-binding universal stress UspA family protein
MRGRFPVLRFASVLCPVDFSASARAALRHAAAVASRWGGHVTVLYAADPLLAQAAEIQLHDRTFLASAKADLERFVEDALPPRLRREVVRGVDVRKGAPAAQILAAARRHHADLIVMGTQGLGQVARFLVGSTAQSVLERANVPVVVVPGRHRRSSARAAS